MKISECLTKGVKKKKWKVSKRYLVKLIGDCIFSLVEQGFPEVSESKRQPRFTFREYYKVS